MTKVIHIKNAPKGFRKVDGDQNGYVYIGRPGRFGNPVTLYGICPVCGQRHSKAGDTLECYGVYLQDRLRRDKPFRDAVYLLKGKTLVCYCKPAPCHGDVLARYADQL